MRSVGRWLGAFEAPARQGLMRLNDELVRVAIRAAGVRRLTADVYGSVVSTGLQVEGARRGFKAHRCKLPSYYPISAYEAQTGQLLRLEPFRECARGAYGLV
jgi:hypothetical protein